MHNGLFVLAIVVTSVCNMSAEAQVVRYGVYYQPAPTTFVQPAPVVQTTYVQPATVYRPLLRPFTRVIAPATTVYATPQPVVVAQPTVPVAVVQPAPVVTTRYRPILGGTVTRTWYP